MQLPSLEIKELYDDVLNLKARRANEDDLKTTLHHFFKAANSSFPNGTVFLGEQSNAMGRPDIQVNSHGKLIGFIELKRPGKGSDPNHFKGHDLAQWEKFKTFKNLIYSDGITWNLFQSEKKVVSIIISNNFENDLNRLLNTFLLAKPSPYIGISDYARNLSSIRNQVAFYLETTKTDSDHKAIESLFSSTFFSNKSEPFSSVFSDFVITVLASVKIICKSDVDVYYDYRKIKLSKYQTDFLGSIFSQYGKSYLAYPLSIIAGNINDLDVGTYNSTTTALKDFFEAYLLGTRPSDKKQDGVFYTPEELVNFHTRLAYKITTNQGLDLGAIKIIDPAAGTGTYSLALLGEFVKQLSPNQRKIQIKKIDDFFKRIVSFEINEGAALVASNKISSYVTSEFSYKKELYLRYFITDTLSKEKLTQRSGKFNEYIKGFQTIIEDAKQTGVINLIIGNPPFHLHKDISSNTSKKLGRKIGAPKSVSDSIALATKRLKLIGFSKDSKFLWDSAIFFLFWSLSRAKRSYEISGEPCIVSLILPRTIISSKFATPIREKILSLSDSITVIDLGGEHRGAISEYNIFNILKAVCILTVAVNGNKAIDIKYAKIHANNDIEFKKILGSLPDDQNYIKVTPNHATNFSFVPDSGTKYPSFVDLRDIVETTLNGIQLKRLWPIGLTKETLQERWYALLTSAVKDRQLLYINNNSQTASKTLLAIGKTINQLDLADPCPKISRFGYRSFDYQWLLHDKALGYSFRGNTFDKHRKGQGYFVGLLTKPASGNSFLSFSDAIVETDFHSKRGAKDVMPLNTPGSNKPNIKQVFLQNFKNLNGYEPKDFMFYALAVLSSKTYCNVFSADTEKYGLRVPIEIDMQAYEKLVRIGKDIATLNSLGNSKWGDKEFNKISPQVAILVCGSPYFKLLEKNIIDIEKGIISGDKWEITGISKDVFDYKLSGYFPIKSISSYWSTSRVKKRSKLDTYFPIKFKSNELKAILNSIHAIEGIIHLQSEIDPLILDLI